MSDSIKPNRFERAEISKVSGGKLRNWHSLDTGEFLSRIWANYGPPDEIGFEGFTYCFRDTETDMFFHVYSAGSGPAFGGNMSNRVDGQWHQAPDLVDKLNATVDAFEQVLVNSKLVDCEIKFDTDFGHYRVGVRNGTPFSEPVNGDDDHPALTKPST